MRMNRKHLKPLLIAVITAAVICTAFIFRTLYSKSTIKERYSTQFLDVFDTASTLIGYDSNEEEFRSRAQAVHKLLLEYHRLFDIYNSYDGLNNLKTVNDNAGVAPVEVDARLIELIKFGKEIYKDSEGRVNIAEGSVLRLWHDKREAAILKPETGELPDAAELENASKHTSIDDIIIDEEGSTLYIADPELSIDVGGIGKGYAVEQAAQLLISMGSDSYLLNIGGNLRAIGVRGDGSSWVCPVENPVYRDGSSTEPYAAVIGLDNRSLVTSGDYERYYTVGTERYHHIIDPTTLYPGHYHRSTSILVGDSALADALSTALFLLSEEDGRSLIDRLNRDRAEEDRIGAMWVDNNGNKSYTENFLKYISQ